jgi:hypothetical protein
LAFRLAVEEAGNLIGDVDRVHRAIPTLHRRTAPPRRAGSPA